MPRTYELGYWLNDDARTFLSRGYLAPGQSAEDRIKEIAAAAEARLPKHKGIAAKIEQYLLRGWMSLSSPIWANFGTNRGLPISCNGSYFEDTTESILMKTAEIGMMTKFGAGTSAYVGALRGRGAAISGGGASNGAVHFLGLIEETTDIISQSSVRRGSCAVYLPIDHPDIEEYLECREEGNAIQHLSLGVCISDAWMEAMIAGDAEKRRIWARVLRKRAESGYPYIFWSDNANNGRPQVWKDLGLPIWASNLCTEIMQPSKDDWSFVCDLLSMNDLHYDAWAGTDAVAVASMLLDAVLSEYIDKTAGIPLMANARNFAIANRAIGVGRLGWHSYLQSKGVPFESTDAKLLNVIIQKTIDEQSLAASRMMAEAYGEAPILKGYGERWATRMAIAPTTSSSFILGAVSPSVEPENSNYYTKDLQKGKFTYKNPYLKEVLAGLGRDTDEVWHSILLTGGSVQHLDFLDANTKAVFKTFGEISQFEIIVQAAGRQKHLDQGQSINLMIHPDTPLKDVNALIIQAWQLGLKSLYYQRSTNPAQEFARELVTCVSCEA